MEFKLFSTLSRFEIYLLSIPRMIISVFEIALSNTLSKYVFKKTTRRERVINKVAIYEKNKGFYITKY